MFVATAAACPRRFSTLYLSSLFRCVFVAEIAFSRHVLRRDVSKGAYSVSTYRCNLRWVFLFYHTRYLLDVVDLVCLDGWPGLRISLFVSWLVLCPERSFNVRITECLNFHRLIIFTYVFLIFFVVEHYSMWRVLYKLSICVCCRTWLVSAVTLTLWLQEVQYIYIYIWLWLCGVLKISAVGWLNFCTTLVVALNYMA